MSATPKSSVGEGTIKLGLTHQFRDRFPELAVDWQSDPIPMPRMVAFNPELAETLGLDSDELQSPAGIAAITGTSLQSGAHPVAMAYAGHQFGGFSPSLGDGRALLLGEIEHGRGIADIHLKGSGRTPFARGGDGKATLGPMLREFVVAEAMHALGIPTTRSLAVVSTGESIVRERLEPGAILVRVAPSHLRVGTFEYAARLGRPNLVRGLIDEALSRHYPSQLDRPDRALALLESVIDAQAKLIAEWMLVGFVHGVMNTDNTAIGGLTIDYGPCAFLDAYDPSAVFSSIDHAGRYRYENQPAVMQWNLTRFAETLLAEIDDDVDRAIQAARECLDTFMDRHRTHRLAIVRRKLAIPTGADAEVAHLDRELFDVMQRTRADLTSAFRSLGDAARGDDAPFIEATRGDDQGARWLERWKALAGLRPLDLVAAELDASNPRYIPRNHLVDAALRAAVDDDREPFDQLLARVTQPFQHRADSTRFAEPAPVEFTERFRTFCGT